jgi:uncharacterized CHY-type Zn-finger protein
MGQQDANDVNLSPGPTHNDTVHDGDYLCGTCDILVDWEDTGVKCETCDQWYHASCQSIHTLSYNQLENTELNISWHCIICNNPNYSSTVHDYQTVDVSVNVTNDSSIPSIPPHSHDNRPLLRPIYSSTPTQNEGQKKRSLAH